jgi:hypothetical protein
MKSLNQLSEVTRHPLVITIVGFMLTGIVGAGFTWWLHSLSSEREIERTQRERRVDFEAASRARAIEAVREVTDLINERRTRAILVASAIYRQSSQAETETRKWSYDDVYVRWNTKAQSISLRIREIFKKLAPTDYEGYLNALHHQMALGDPTPPMSDENNSRHEGLLTLIDACITDAFDAYRRDKFENATSALKILNSCNINTLNLKLIGCSNVMADSLYVIVNTLDSEPTSVDNKIRTDSVNIKAACNPRSSAS